METFDITYPSTDGHTTVHARLWLPEDLVTHHMAPRGVVQLVHGMAEHIGRYERFAAYLVRRGFAVIGNDHVGHGKTAAAPEDLGHLPLDGGEDILVEDVHALRSLVEERFALAGVEPVPFVLIGHSLGSFIVRVYLTRHADGVDAAVISGTGQQTRALTKAGWVLTHLMARFRGARHRSRLVDAMGAGGYGRKIKGAKTALDWLSTDRAVVDAYRDDPLSGAVFTLGGYATVAALAADAQRTELLDGVSRDLPLFFMSGAEDPVGEFGRGVKRAVAQYRAAGFSDVEEHLYSGARHELLNEPVHGEVERDLMVWLERHGI